MDLRYCGLPIVFVPQARQHVGNGRLCSFLDKLKSCEAHRARTVGRFQHYLKSEVAPQNTAVVCTSARHGSACQGFYLREVILKHAEKGLFVSSDARSPSGQSVFMFVCVVNYSGIRHTVCAPTCGSESQRRAFSELSNLGRLPH